MSRPISRRTILRGLGTALALPVLEAMRPLASAAPEAAKAATAPRRMAFVYVPNGMNMGEFTPEKFGRDYKLSPLLETLAEFKGDFSVLSGLTLDKARANGDGPGDHARANSVFLTGRQPRKTHGADIKVGISVDQLAAQRIGDKTRLPSLEIGCEGGLQSGNCDSGYSCAYSANLSWRSETTPQPKEINPKAVFDRLFSSDSGAEAVAARARRDRYRKSILDLVEEDAKDLRKDLGVADQRKLDQYLDGVREIELRIERAGKEGFKEPPKPDMAQPQGTPRDYKEHIHLLADLMVLAFQTDSTRVCTFAFANDGSNRSYKQIDVPEGHHDLSHHESRKERLDKIKKINQFHLEQFAYLLGKLKAVKEGEGTLLDNCMIVYGSGIGDGNRHNHDNLPILLAGKGGGAFHPGQHMRVPRETPLMNLYLAMLAAMGVRVDALGDSTGRLEGA